MNNIDENDIAKAFWIRVDSKRGKTSLLELASMCDMSFVTLRNQKSGKNPQLPKTLQAFNLAKALDTSIEFLLTGKEAGGFNRMLSHAYQSASESNKKIVDIALGLNQENTQTEMISV